ncbi:MAG: ATP/GTP-binding protein [Thermoprotei archaeon]
MTIVAVFTGPAGSGKSTLVATYTHWLKRELFLRVAPVNLDPGAELLKYKPVFDIRSLFTLRDIMTKYGLGPNGAFLKASELIVENVDKVFNSEPFTNLSKWDIVLIDTPGQMEAFIFRKSSAIFFDELEKISQPVLVYVLDASAVYTLADAITLWFMSVLLQAKLGLTVVPVVNKVDIASDIEPLKLLVEKPDELFKIAKEKAEEGLLSEIIPELLSIAIKTKAPLRTVFVSATTGQGIRDMHMLIHEAFCTCGDLT